MITIYIPVEEFAPGDVRIKFQTDGMATRNESVLIHEIREAVLKLMEKRKAEHTKKSIMPNPRN